MPDSLAVDIKASMTWLFSETLDLSSVNDQGRLDFTQSLADGVGVDQADMLFHDQRGVGNGANDDLDLTALTHSIFGSTVNYSFAKVKGLMIANLSTTAGDMLRVGGAGAGLAFAAPFNGNAAAVVEVPAEGCLLLVHRKSGWTVTPGTGDILRVHNPGGTTVVYHIVIVGTRT